MISFALAHAAAGTAPVFHPDFYVAAATIVPVLFVALAVEGHGYDNIIKAYERVSRHDQPGRPWYERFAASLAGSYLQAFALIIAGFAGYSEIMAIYALYQWQADGTTATIVLLGPVFLVIFVSAGPLITITRVSLLTGLPDLGLTARQQAAGPARGGTGSAQMQEAGPDSGSGEPGAGEPDPEH
jgi:hypothetical protein